MSDERIYVIVPKTVQVQSPSHWGYGVTDTLSEEKSHPMVAGRLIAQGVHVGRLLERIFANSGVPYREITTITLSVRNSKELTKVSNEAKSLLLKNDPHGCNLRYTYGEFHDTNYEFYGTEQKIHTITAIGPVTREAVEDAIGHLELY
jgi:hypothetical protein